MNYFIMQHFSTASKSFPEKKLLCCLVLCGLLCSPAALAAPSADSGEWHVRLTVKAEDGREDSGNVLGRLKDSTQGPDSHDLPEMPPPPPPMGDRYLSIVFPHPEWKTEMPDYASDFRNVPAGPDAADLWNFEVRTHTPGIKAKLTWQGPAEILQRSRIKEAKSGKVLVENCGAAADAPVLLTKEPLAFIWEYQPQAAEKK
uniref:hypothetical protein n=1 Tax=Candidatus Electronema sp. TaxID=2698783 RepID=UPI0040571221